MKKKVLLFGLLLALTSCELDDEDRLEVNFELSPIVEVDLPETFTLGALYEIPVTYERASTCHSFDGFRVESLDSTRNIAVANAVIVDDTCEPLESDLREVSLRFEVRFDQTYIFNFYQGDDADGNPIYLTREVPVEQ